MPVFPHFRRLPGLAVLFSLLACGFAQSAEPSPVRAWAAKELDSLTALYRHLHQNPELSFHEQATAARMAEEFRQAGYEVTTGVGGHGVVGVLKNGEGPRVMLRADLDALPVVEQTGLAYASRVKVTLPSGAEVGVMHACGHDVHMTTLVGTARYLAAHRDQWRGTVLLIGQPAEETGAGAQAMLDDKLFDRFGKPDFALALHVFPEIPAGTVGYRAGYSMANVDSVDIIVKGKGGHGAYPQATIDPIVQAAELILSLQTIVSREVKPLEPAVVTVGSIHGGSKHNIISEECHLQLTVRSYTDEVRQQILDAIVRKAKGVALAHRAPEPAVKMTEGTPALYNDDKLTARMRGALEGALGKENVLEREPSMGGEDFGRFGRAGVPIMMFALGAIEGRRIERMQQLGQTLPSLHSPIFYPDTDEALVTGVVALTSTALDLLKK
jgi:amidohydrolase